jgi:Raf kinase inhibitor-like YbhB/YbcL family protein
MERRMFFFLVSFFFLLAFVQCGKDGNSKNPGGTAMGTMTVTSTAFKEGEMIPKKYTCDDRDVSPQLAWANVPAGSKSIALICDDPDAPVGTWVHWVVFNIPATATGLAEGVTSLPAGTLQGLNDFRKLDYGGPCPPGGTHRYFFKVYALDTVLTLKERVSKGDLLKAMEGHILGQGQLMGKYKRS